LLHRDKKENVLKYRPDNHLVLCPQYQTSKRKDLQNNLGAGGGIKKKKSDRREIKRHVRNLISNVRVSDKFTHI